MKSYRRLSPISVPFVPETTEERDGWKIVLSHRHEDPSLAIIDLSHIRKWEIYGPRLHEQMLDSLYIPRIPGQISLSKDMAVALCRPSVALAWQFNYSAFTPSGTATYADVTDGYALLALIGDDGPRIMEKITNVDLALASNQHARLIQGPFLDIPAKIMVFSMGDCNKGMLIGVARGFGQSVVDVILDAGIEFGLKPAGEKVFERWFKPFAEKCRLSAIIKKEKASDRDGISKCNSFSR